MRARNPWVLARLRLFGWKVRLLILSTPSLAGRPGVGPGSRGWSRRRYRAAPPGRKAGRLYPRALCGVNEVQGCDPRTPPANGDSSLPGTGILRSSTAKSPDRSLSG